MKKILFILTIIAVMLVPFSAFAAVTEYNSGIRWNDILAENELNVGDNYVIWRDTAGYYYIAYQTGNGFENVTANSDDIADINALTMEWSASNHTWKVYKSNSRYNPFGPYSRQTYGYGDDQITYTWRNVSAICANSRAITYDANTVLEPCPIGQTTSNTVNTTAETVTHDNFSSVVTAPLLSGVLVEVIGVLPVVVPVVITFIAIRKGIKFVLAMLRSA